VRPRSRVLLWLVPLLLLVGLFVLLQTPWGLRTALQIALGPAGLTLDGARGNWMRSVEVRGVAFEDEGIRLRVDTAQVRYNLFALVWGEIRANQVTASGVDLVVKPVPTPQDTVVTGAPPKIRASGVTIRQSQLTVPMEPDTILLIEVDYLQGMVSLFADSMDTVRLDSTDLVVHAGHLPLRVGPTTRRGR